MSFLLYPVLFFYGISSFIIWKMGFKEVSSFPLESFLSPLQDDARVAMENTSPTLLGELPLQANFCSLSIFLSLCYIVSHSESKFQSITFSAESFLWKQLAVCPLFCSLLCISRHEPWWQGYRKMGPTGDLTKESNDRAGMSPLKVRIHLFVYLNCYVFKWK